MQFHESFAKIKHFPILHLKYEVFFRSVDVIWRGFILTHSLTHLYNIHYIDVHDGFSITPLSFHFTNINVLSLNNLKEK